MQVKFIWNYAYVFWKGIYMNMGRALCTAIGTMTWVHTQFFLHFFAFFLKITSGYEYALEHTRRSVPSTGIQPGRKERIQIWHKHKQDTVAFGFWFLVCYAATQLATPLQQWHIQVVRSNKVARKRLTKSHGNPAMDFGSRWRNTQTQVYTYEE